MIIIKHNKKKTILTQNVFAFTITKTALFSSLLFLLSSHYCKRREIKRIKIRVGELHSPPYEPADINKNIYICMNIYIYIYIYIFINMCVNIQTSYISNATRPKAMQRRQNVQRCR
ncbi:hypothetical protein, unlikely [Trypanosoma brucei gambiense DAL972]|uniref:Uncharacterized protein n=1 Tax=Trypanosoma brucei gambiense (strain MHOM/CI/86/DAL972) TaxID=679716 RepID=C9ZRS2_TRYB9|nr:hypothetical protein, unlikely [Trypanosoma brucei gambiense DAL972]CBH12058.1 hypothetical protein, unlikely [Trypanosoma brucei gambiense DAL972]|eukprot:XP_011774341.1 hypothetical protein, unlikely [Trypanosoma brucei gambiense DAL972]